MKNIYSLLLATISTAAFAQQSISFETTEGYQLGTINQQNNWEVTDGADGFLLNQVISNEKASTGTFSFKNAYEPNYGDQFMPIFGASKTFETPLDYTDLTISYDVLATEKNGADFEFVLFTINADEEYVPIAGVGIENRGMIYVIKNADYGIDYAEAEWTPDTWVNVKVHVTTNEIKYYINNVLQNTIENFTKLNAAGFNMLHNNYGGSAYYDNFVITTDALTTKPFETISYSVYPNPAQNTISIVLPSNTELSEAAIYTITGQKVLTTTNSENIDISQLVAGTYFLKASTTDGASFTKKIMKN